MIKDDYPHIAKARDYTSAQLTTIRQEIQQSLTSSEYREAITLVTTGSYGRGEATEESDLDWFIIFDRDQPAEEVIKDELAAVEKVIAKYIPKNTGDTGTFGKDAVVRFSDMQRNIGGDDDSNKSLTRRLLFLLEGTWLYGEEHFDRYRKQLLEKYIKPSSPDEQIPRFLLNDIIRYYRTMATDFEHKTVEKDKEWGLRNIKLRFSRKLIYFSGIIVAAELHGRSWEEKIAKALELFDQPSLARIEGLSGNLECTPAILGTYESYLAKVMLPQVREKLEAVEKEKRFESPEYKELRNISHEFSRALHTWLEEKYPPNHIIHHALVF